MERIDIFGQKCRKSLKFRTTVLPIGMLIGVYEVHTSNYNACLATILRTNMTIWNYAWKNLRNSSSAKLHECWISEKYIVLNIQWNISDKLWIKHFLQCFSNEYLIERKWRQFFNCGSWSNSVDFYLGDKCILT